MSDWKKSAAARRDERATRVSDEDHRPITAKKDSKRWCRGKVGVPHRPKCFPYSIRGAPFDRWRVLACERCGRQLALYAPFNFGLRSAVPPPAWVE